MPGSINRSFALAIACAALFAAPALAQDRSRNPAPVGNPGMWFTDDDYPVEAKRAGRQGRVALELAVDANGRVTGCRVTESSGSTVLDTATCQLASTRASFEPAHDSAGNAVAGTFKVATRWVLGVPRIALSGPMRTASVLNVDPAGKILSCVDAPSPSEWFRMFRCSSLPTMNPKFGEQLLAGKTLARPVDITAESAIDLDGRAPLAMTYQQPGQILISVTEMHFDIGADGMTSNCKLIQPRLANKSQAACKSTPGPFIASGRKRGATFRLALSRTSGE